jgi:hypothetical protein
MTCNCAILFLDNKKYLVKCISCSNISNSIDNKSNNEINDEFKYKFKWYEKHIEIYRDCPQIRMGVELILLIGWVFMLGLCWLQWLKITGTFGNFTLNMIGTICFFWIICLFGYLDSIQKLRTNSKYFL